jgi:phenylalanyl-tRNA synthetase beta chain
MKISYNWLKELIDIDENPETVAELLTMSGSEVEAIEKKGFQISGVVAGKIIEIDKHPKADKLTICTVDTGSSNVKVVCGAPNVKIGLKVLFAGIGSTLADGNKLGKAKIRGIESAGMILAEDELGITEDHTAIIELGNGIAPGTPLDKIIPIKDYIFELEITPNRPDCLSHVGIARELQALTGKRIKYPDFTVDETGPEISRDLAIEIEDPDGCPRYTGRLISDVKVGQSPLWLKMRLFYLGIRPINNVVDITNYVLLETGHPLHAFDYSFFKSRRVVVKKAGQGEKFATLDQTERELNENHLLITDGAQPVALAGIMGGLNSEVTESTTRILLESAYFDPITIRRGAKAVGLSTESSQRFERGADPLMAPKANNRACLLIDQLAGGKVHKGMVDAYPKKFVPAKIDFRPQRLDLILGIHVEPDKIKRIFSGLDIPFEDDAPMRIEQPSFRPDLTREVDLIEEVARIYGLNNIPDVFRPGGRLETEVQPEIVFKNRLRNVLVGRGFIESFSLTLTDAGQLKKIDKDLELLTLQNPLSEEISALRPNLAVSMIKNLRHNINYGNKDLKLFEIGRIYKPSSGELADEKDHICIGLSGREKPISWRHQEKFADFYSLKGELEVLFSFFNIELFLEPSANSFYENSCCYVIKSNGDNLMGVAGKVSAAIAKLVGLKQDCYICEFDFESFKRIFPGEKYFRALPRYPSSDRDIALVLDDAVPAAGMLKTIRDVCGELAEDIFIFDVYRGQGIPEGKKSLAVRIIYRSSKNTLTDEEVDFMHNSVIERLNREFGAVLRS